jgi:hypothetical protein
MNAIAATRDERDTPNRRTLLNLRTTALRRTPTRADSYTTTCAPGRAPPTSQNAGSKPYHGAIGALDVVGPGARTEANADFLFAAPNCGSNDSGREPRVLFRRSEFVTEGSVAVTSR